MLEIGGSVQIDKNVAMNIAMKLILQMKCLMSFLCFLKL